MSRFSHKHILLYGHTVYDQSRKLDSFSYKNIFGEISSFRIENASARKTIDGYVNLILYSANTQWRRSIQSAGQSYCNQFLRRNKSIMIVPDPEKDREFTNREQDDILPDLLILSAADHYFRKAWNNYQNVLDKKLPEYFDFQAADKYRRELIEVMGEKSVNNLFVQMWHVFYGQSFMQVFHQGFTSVILDSALDVEYNTAENAWQILLENFKQ